MDCKTAGENKYTMFFVVVNFGVGSEVLEEAKKNGVLGGTIFLGKGTAKSHILEILGLEEIKKEIVLMVTEKEIEEGLYKILEEKFYLSKPNKGIAFSINVDKIFGARRCMGIDMVKNEGSMGAMEENKGYEVIFTIVDRGMAEEVVDAAVLGGAEGGTIVNGRGSSIHENSKFFGMSLEPEKEIVMILIEKTKIETVVNSIRKNIQIDIPGKGIMFSMGVNNTSGIFNSSKE